MKHSLDLAQLDAVTAALHHIITPTRVNPVHAILSQGHDIPCPVRDLTEIRLETIAQEICSSFLRIAPVTLRDAGTSDPQLTLTSRVSDDLLAIVDRKYLRVLTSDPNGHGPDAVRGKVG